MTLAKVFSISLCMGAGSLAFATDPAAPAATPPAATAATAPATADAASTAAADQAKSTTTTATQPAGVTPEQAKTLKSGGYKAEVRKGVTYYCRSETHVGSRFETKVCGTPDGILRSIANNQELVNQLQHSPLSH